MTYKTEEYRRRAEEAERKAEETTDLEAKRAYWQVADTYRELLALDEKESSAKT